MASYNNAQLADQIPFSRYPPWVLSKLRPQAVDLIHRVYKWVETECIPAEQIMKAQVAQNRWKTAPLMHELRKKAKSQGLWNIFLPNHFKESPGLTNLEYSCCAEIMGQTYWAAQTMNCHAPETGNMELLAKYCTDAQKEKWLRPLMNGDFSSAYSMTEPDKATSDATNVSCRITQDGDEYVINGRKLYGNALWNEEMKLYILMGCSDPGNPDVWKRHTMLLVPSNSKGLTMRRNLTIMGYDHAPEGHGEYIYNNVRVPKENVILGEGRAFEIAQGRLGPGRIHHCMRLIGQCERAYELALLRCKDPRKRPRGKYIGQFDSNIERLATMRIEIDALRLVVLNAADTMDAKGNKAGRYVIAQSKILVPETAAKIVDTCMQMYAGQGLTQHTPLPEIWTYARFVRVADGPDAAHRHQVGRDQLKLHEETRKRHQAYAERARALRKTWGIENPDAELDWEYVPPTAPKL
ncbi:acyl-CoA dehydrogenase family member 11 [Exophiala viscosa]|uniref:Acyl-CoA dehydrogenase family member 11 n=1 Tax=Exophiala viscosa TaxID=2486360 RepID=A0AAN6ICF8_9EURO|nr:acyl-CoA dehydrogenase family member 11 [Exophiala viscosa]KAI1625799.1 acyl-CoA dehydrogenase family member 11 [Exophiala viscosa]